jgi:hypothetical protein
MVTSGVSKKSPKAKQAKIQNLLFKICFSKALGKSFRIRERSLTLRIRRGVLNPKEKRLRPEGDSDAFFPYAQRNMGSSLRVLEINLCDPSLCSIFVSQMSRFGLCESASVNQLWYQ